MYKINHIILGTGRVIPFNVVGDRSPGLGEIIVLIRSNNLPAQDDEPIAFVNVENLFDIPVAYLKELRYIYFKNTVWLRPHDIKNLK